MTPRPNRRRFSDDDLRACHAEGLTAPESAIRLDASVSAVYRRAKPLGLRFANRKGETLPPHPLTFTPEAEAKRRAGHAAAVERQRNTPINGWTWQQLMDAGFTACEAARVRGQTYPAAYAFARATGQRWPASRKDPRRNAWAGLSTQEREDYARVKRKLGCGMDEALRMIGRADLIEKRIECDPVSDMAARMRASAAQTRARLIDADMADFIKGRQAA